MTMTAATSLAPSRAQTSNQLTNSDLEVIAHAAQTVDRALGILKKMSTTIENLREMLTAHFSPKKGSFAASTIGTELSKQVSNKLNERKLMVENNITSALNPLRERYRGRTFEKKADTPKALLYIAVPSHKVGRVVAFDTLRETLRSNLKQNFLKPPLGAGDKARICLGRKNGGKKELLELCYDRPGRVSVYVNGRRIGKMWTDDAQKVAKAFADGKEMRFRKAKPVTNYTIC